MRSIYLDNAATTRVAPEVAEIVAACMRDDYGNPSSAHRVGIAASERLRIARELVLAAIGDERGAAGDVVWTSGGTEADALGTAGVLRAKAGRGKHAVATAIEHPAVLGTLKLLDTEGFETTLAPVTTEGGLDVSAVVDAVTERTTLVACMLVQNELGTVFPVAEVVRAVKAKRPGVHVHCDAVQALGKIPIDVRTLGADTVAFSGHKIYGPKGIGVLWVKKGVRLAPLWAGGGQQGGTRSGTENVPGIAGMGEAARLALLHLAEDSVRIAALRDRLVESLLARVDGRLHGAGTIRVPHIASVGLSGVPAEPLLHALEDRGVYVSAGSACASRSHGPSHVLRAVGIGEEVGTLRLSLSREVSEADVDYAAGAIVECAGALLR